VFMFFLSAFLFFYYLYRLSARASTRACQLTGNTLSFVSLTGRFIFFGLHCFAFREASWDRRLVLSILHFPIANIPGLEFVLGVSFYLGSGYFFLILLFVSEWNGMHIS
jgi:hypothetical protein